MFDFHAWSPTWAAIDFTTPGIGAITIVLRSAFGFCIMYFQCSASFVDRIWTSNYKTHIHMLLHQHQMNTRDPSQGLFPATHNAKQALQALLCKPKNLYTFPAMLVDFCNIQQEYTCIFYFSTRPKRWSQSKMQSHAANHSCRIMSALTADAMLPTTTTTTTTTTIKHCLFDHELGIIIIIIFGVKN